MVCIISVMIYKGLGMARAGGMIQKQRHFEGSALADDEAICRSDCYLFLNGYVNLKYRLPRPAKAGLAMTSLLAVSC